MGKVIKVLLSLFLMISIIPIKISNAKNIDIINSDLYLNYLSKLSREYKTCSDVETNLDLKDEYLSFFVDKNTEDFDALLNSIPLLNQDFQIITTEEITEKGKQIISVISREEQTQSLFYVEAEENGNYIVFVVNGEKYIIYMNGEDLIMESNDGSVLYLSKTEIIKECSVTERVSTPRESPFATYPYTLSEDNLYTKDVGPGEKTNKELVKVLSAISTIGGLAVAKVSTTIGTILGVVGVGALIGDYVYSTFYIKFWQAYKLSDPSYWREKQRWFYDSGHYEFQKNNTTYFYTSQPN